MARTLNLKLPKLPGLPVDAVDGLRVILRPVFWLVLGIHAFLLFAPLNEPSKPKPPQDKKAPVRITQLPSSKPGAKPLSKEQLLKQAQTTLSKVSNPTPSTVQVPKKKALDIPPQQLREAIALTQSQAQPTATSPGPAIPGEPFPHYPGSQPGCYGKDACRTANASRETVAAFFEKELPAKKWEITPAPDEGDAKVYVVVSKSGSQYLSLLIDSGKTIYVLGSAPVPNIAALKDSIEPPGLYYQVITDLAEVNNPTKDESQTPTQPRQTQFAQPDFFYSASADPDAAPDKSGADAAKLIYGQSPEAVLAQIRGQSASVLQISSAGSYGGGALYQMQPKSGKALFLSLLTANDGSGTILVTWLQDPR
jgi:hypothetical protein